MLEGHSKDRPQGYAGYVLRALYYPAMTRTVQGLLGLIFGKPSSKQNVPVAYEDELKDITLSGVGIDDFTRMLGQEVLTTGRAGILVDRPTTEAAPLGSLRPYWVTYSAEQIINWRTERINGEIKLTRVVLFEQEELDDEKDEFVPLVVDRYRVLLLEDGKYIVRIYHRNEEKTTITTTKDEWIYDEDIVPLRRNKPLDYIPFIFANKDSIDSNISHPPLLDLVDVNYSHYRTSADQEHGAHFTALPTPFVSGHTLEQGQELAIGSGTAWILTDPQARAGMVEFSGAGLKSLADLKEEKRQLMVTLGARMLETQKNTQEAATTVAMRHAGERSSLAVLADSLGQAVTTALKWHLYWNGLEDAAIKDVSYTLNPEVADILTSEDIKVLVTTWQAGAISHKTLYENLEYAEITRQNVPFEEEIADIEEETPEMVPTDALGNPVPIKAAA